MTSTAAPIARPGEAGATNPSPSPSPTRAWLYGPVPDLLLGCGVGSLCMMAAIAWYGTGHLAAILPTGLMILIFSLPHYGATLVRVYDRPEDRREYAMYAWWVSFGLAALFVFSLYSPLLGSILLTIYLTWSPWHYTGQNYGIVSLMLGRRGVAVPELGRRALRYSFWLSYALTFLAMHGVERAANYTPVPYQGSVYQLLPLGLPGVLTTPLLAAVSVAYVGLTGFAIVSLLRARGGGLRACAPAFVLMLTQTLWFSFPVLFRYLRSSVGDVTPFANVYTAYGFLWIAAAHAVQYLWITSYFYGLAPPESPLARRPETLQRGTYLAKAALSGFAIWIVPAVLFAPAYLGHLPAEVGLSLMVAAMVNLHHFILDGAIWKLRRKSVSDRLLGSDAAGAEPIEPLALPAHQRWLAPAVYAVGALAIGVNAASWWEGERGFEASLARGDYHRASDALDRLAWLGADGPGRRTRLARKLASESRHDEALDEFAHSLDLHPTPDAWYGIGTVREQQQDWPQALEAYQAAIDLDPEDVKSHTRAGLVLLQMREPVRATPFLERAVELAPDQSTIRAALERAKRRSSADPSAPTATTDPPDGRPTSGDDALSVSLLAPFPTE